MRTLLVTDNFPPQLGGIARLLADFCAAQPPGEIVVLAPSGTPGKPFSRHARRMAREHDKTLAYPVVRMVHPGNTGNDLVTLLALGHAAFRTVAACRRHGCGLVLFGKLWPLALAGPVLRRFGIPYAVYCYGNEVLKPLGGRARRWRLNALMHAERVITISGYMVEKITAMGVPPERVVKIQPKVEGALPPGLPDPEIIKWEEGLKGKKVLLSVGRLVERKGFDRVIEAMPAVLAAHPDAVYVILGDGPDRRRLELLAKGLKLGRAVRFAGAKASTEPYYQACDVFIMPSRADEASGDVEGFGIVFLEANRHGRPVIGGNSGGIPDAVADGVSGLLVDPESPAAIAAAVNRLFSEPEYAEELGRKGAERVRAEFSIGRYAQEYREKVIEPLRRGEHPPAPAEGGC